MKTQLSKSRPFLITAFTLAVSLLAPTPGLSSPSAANCPVKVEQKFVRGVSMAELFAPETPIQAEMGYYACHKAERGEIVLIQASGRPDPLMKIIQVVPDDKIALVPSAGAFTLNVNGVPLLTPKGQPYAFSGKAFAMLKLYVESFKGVMPAGTYFVFGTEPAGSYDSSRFGPVTTSALLGRVTKS